MGKVRGASRACGAVFFRQPAGRDLVLIRGNPNRTPRLADPVIEAYKKDVDRTMLRENLKLTVQERFEKLEKFARFARELQQAGERSRTRREPR